MAKKILIIVLILVVLFGLFGLWFLIANKPIPFVESLSNGSIGNILGFGRPSSQPNKPAETETPITIVDAPEETTNAEIPRLQRLTANAVSGANFTYIERPIKEDVVVIPFTPIDFTGYPTIKL